MSYELNSDFLWKEIGRQVVILHFKSGVYWTLNETASFIFKELVDKENTEDAVADKLTLEYDIDKKTALHDIEEFIEQCKQKDVF